MLMKRLKPRKFVYTPRFYEEEKDENGDGRRIRFKRMPREGKKGSSMLKLALLFIAVFVLLYYLMDITYFKIG